MVWNGYGCRLLTPLPNRRQTMFTYTITFMSFQKCCLKVPVYICIVMALSIAVACCFMLFVTTKAYHQTALIMLYIALVGMLQTTYHDLSLRGLLNSVIQPRTHNALSSHPTPRGSATAFYYLSVGIGNSGDTISPIRRNSCMRVVPDRQTSPISLKPFSSAG